MQIFTSHNKAVFFFSPKKNGNPKKKKNFFNNLLHNEKINMPPKKSIQRVSHKVAPKGPAKSKKPKAANVQPKKSKDQKVNLLFLKKNSGRSQKNINFFFFYFRRKKRIRYQNMFKFLKLRTTMSLSLMKIWNFSLITKASPPS